VRTDSVFAFLSANFFIFYYFLFLTTTSSRLEPELALRRVMPSEQTHEKAVLER